MSLAIPSTGNFRPATRTANYIVCSGLTRFVVLQFPFDWTETYNSKCMDSEEQSVITCTSLRHWRYVTTCNISALEHLGVARNG